ncbi:MAG: EAL domain-containing protein, partial [bacterium]|nr:EAL domain-containing protein [bacterium]
LGDGAEAARTCEALRALGASLARDDFGTGFSSLSHLFRFQIDVLKIDRSFTAEIRASERARAIIAAMIAMSHRLGITVIAEGVEEPEESDYMRDEGCDLLQGFGICRPALPDAVASWVRGQLVACTAT